MLEKLVARLARALSRRAGLHLSRVALRAPQGSRIESPGSEVRCEATGLLELLPSCADRALELPEDQVRAASKRGERCVVAYVGKRLVGYMWIATAPAPYVAGLWVEFDPADCYFYKKFVHPAFRGLRISDALDTEADKVALGLGRKRIVGFIDLQNTPSWKALQRRKARTAGYAGYLAWFGASIPFRTPGAARSGFRFFSPRARPIASEPA